MNQRPVPALFMRGGTSKGVFFNRADLPQDPALRDRVLLRVIGSPDPYARHIDGMGGGTSSTSKVVLLSPPTRPDCDVDYCFGQVAVSVPLIDWSGNCGNLSAAVGPAAMHLGLLGVPADGVVLVRIWQANIGKRIDAWVPVADGAPVDAGDFMLDGVAFGSAEIRLDFLDPAGTAERGIFPTGCVVETLAVEGAGEFSVSLVDAGLPTVFVDASALGLDGTEGQGTVNGSAELLVRVEALRSHAAVRMGLASSPHQSTSERPHVPKVCAVEPPAAYTASDGRAVPQHAVDLLARVFSMGRLHHAMTGTGAVALAVAASVPGTLVQRAARPREPGCLRFGHPSGVLQ
ncbi:MAG: 2-methylaconitate cis-trans isomerase PrpF, partial [Rubrivivax sp.]